MNNSIITGGRANDGTGAQADAIDYTGGTNNKLTLTSASRAADGGLVGGIGIRGSLEISRDASGSGSTTLTSVIHDYDNRDGDTANDAGSVTKTGAGALVLNGASTYTGGTTLSTGTLVLNAAQRVQGSELISSAAGTGNITFAAGAQTLDLTVTTLGGSGGTFANKLIDFGDGDVLRLEGYTGTATASLDQTGTVLTVTSSSRTESFTLDESYANRQFAVAYNSASNAVDVSLTSTVPPNPPPTPTGPTPGPDNQTGTDDPDTVRLLAGNDTYRARDGNDLIYGNQGRDLIYAEDGNDTVYGGQNDDRIPGGDGSDRLYGNLGNDRLYGGEGRDFLYGGQGDDYLAGEDGPDVLVGGLGDDTLRGGSGNDRYEFSPDPGARDLVLGFSTAEGDRLDLNGQDYRETFAANGDVVLQLSGGGSVQLSGVKAQEFGNGAGYFVG